MKEKRIAIIHDGIVKEVFYIGIPSKIKEEDVNRFAEEQAKKACLNLGMQGQILFLSEDQIASAGDEYREGSFFSREKKTFHIAYERGNKIKIIDVEDFADERTLTGKLRTLCPGVYEFHIIPEDQHKEIKGLPTDALELSDPEIIISKGKKVNGKN